MINNGKGVENDAGLVTTITHRSLKGSRQNEESHEIGSGFLKDAHEIMAIGRKLADMVRALDPHILALIGPELQVAAAKMSGQSEAWMDHVEAILFEESGFESEQDAVDSMSPMISNLISRARMRDDKKAVRSRDNSENVIQLIRN